MSSTSSRSQTDKPRSSRAAPAAKPSSSSAVATRSSSGSTSSSSSRNRSSASASANASTERSKSSKSNKSSERALAEAARRRVGERRADDRRRPGQSSDESLAARIRANQYNAVMGGLPLAVAALGINAVIVGALAPGLLPDMVLLGWLFGMIVLSAVGIKTWMSWKSAARSVRVTAKRLHTVAILSGVIGAGWTAVPATLFTHAAAVQQTLLASTMIGTLAAGSFTLAAIPNAAHAFVASVSIGAMISFALTPSEFQIYGIVQWLMYTVIAAGGVTALSKTLHARVSAEARSEQQHQLIGLLLRDFEEQGSDVLWELDAKGRLVHVAKRLADALGRDSSELNGRNFLSLLGDMQKNLADGDKEQATTLRDKLTHGQPFRDVLLPMMMGGQTRWWSVTAKPLTDERGTAIGWRGVARDVTQTRLNDRRLAYLAHYDTLTGLINRAQFRVMLESALQGARNRIGQGAVMCLDLDGFKTVNDTLGHATGDALLQEVARRLKSAVSKNDIVARLGGDEFAILRRHSADEAEVRTAAEMVIEAMRKPCEALGAIVPVRASIGIARYPQDGSTVDEMLAHADMALYDAKSNAPGSIRFFVGSMGEQVRRRLVLERDLRDAMEHNQLSLHFQPKVSLQSWEIHGFEALLRWNHPEHGMIPPTEFIPVAEESGLIVEMGEWALMEACRQAVTWPGHMQVAVNISPVQIMAQDLQHAVKRALSESGLPPDRLEVEITESVFINETRSTFERLHALRKLGVQIALDDFGTGYSSLAYLRRFPFDTLKIDRAFVRELLISRDARSIVRNILALAKSLRMQTVAEGVEEPAQVNVLESEGCDLVQGYFASRPIPAEQVVSFVEAWGQRDRPSMPRDFQLANTQTASLNDLQMTGV